MIFPCYFRESSKISILFLDFYTAITRAKKDLKLFCSADSMHEILNTIKSANSTRIKDKNKDLHLLKNKKALR